MLVGVGSALFTIVSAYGWSDFEFSARSGVAFDPTRISAQIVTGIGFLGAGAIIRQGFAVRGLTTAAALWVVAAIGMAAGAGFYTAAVITTGVVLVGLGPLRWIEGGRLGAPRAGRSRTLEIDLTREHPVDRGPGRDRFKPGPGQPRRVRARSGTVGACASSSRSHYPADERLVDDLAALEGVRGVRWGE